MILPPPNELRASGGYALVDGVWWPSSRPVNGKDAVLLQKTTGTPAPGFSAGSRPGVFLRKVKPSQIQKLVKIVVSVSVDGIGPFTVTSVDDSRVHVVYEGSDRDAAALLPDLRRGDPYMEGGDILGFVDLSRVSEAHEEVTPEDISGRGPLLGKGRVDRFE